MVHILAHALGTPEENGGIGYHPYTVHNTTAHHTTPGIGHYGNVISRHGEAGACAIYAHEISIRPPGPSSHQRPWA